MLLKSVHPFNPEAPLIEPHVEPRPVHPVPHHHHPAPHHGHIAPPPPHLHGPGARHGLVSVKIDPDKMMDVYGEDWAFYSEKIAVEPPETKILFALIMEFEISVNTQLLESLEDAFRDEPAYKFANPALDDEIVALLAEKLGVDGGTLYTILEHAHDGVVAVIAAKAKK